MKPSESCSNCKMFNEELFKTVCRLYPPASVVDNTGLTSRIVEVRPEVSKGNWCGQWVTQEDNDDK